MIFLWSGGFVAAALLVVVVVRHMFRSDKDPAAVEFARQRLFALAHARGWRLRGEAGELGIEDANGEHCLVLATGEVGCDDGDTLLVLRRCASPAAFSVWPRDPSDAARERWGDEVEIGDPVFDTRFAILARVPRGVLAPILSPALCKGLLDLEEPTLLASAERVALRFPGVPSDETLDRAIHTLRAFPTAPLARPYRE